MARKKAEPKVEMENTEIGTSAEEVTAASAVEAETSDPNIEAIDGANHSEAEGEAAESAQESEPADELAPDAPAVSSLGEIPAADGEPSAIAGEEPLAAEQQTGISCDDGDSEFYESGLASGSLDTGDVPDEGAPADNSEEQGESEYGSLLSEVSSMGLNDQGSDTPLTLPEQGGISADASGTEESAFESESLESGDATHDEASDQTVIRPEVRRRAPMRRPAATPRRDERILTIDAHDEVQSEAEREAALWHEIQNAMRTRRILTGTLDSVERTDSGMTLAIVSYNGFRVAIPQKEMMLYSGRMPSGREYDELMMQVNRNLNARLGSEIDFIVKGCDNASRSVVASRKDAMLRKRQTFYMDTNELGDPMIYEGRVVQARVVAVAEKIMRVEVFGVECAIRAPGMSWMWIGNARDHYNVGDRVLVRVLRISKPNVQDLKIEADIRSVSSVTSADNLSKCVVQGRYAGRVTDVRGGVVFIRLNNGVNAVAHSCYDARTPGKKDDVSFAVTRLDEEQGVAHGLITRIIRQNI